ncbi:MAG: glycosyltransferase [Clostridia bacterium]|nr:glycosyltransferase [Clostridia bacterium]
MKIVQINATCNSGSTGKICYAISQLLNEKGIENYILYSLGISDYEQGIKYTNEKYLKRQALKSRIFGNYGFNSKGSTKKLISELEKTKPDIIHLHNIHSNDVNLKMLFDYIRDNKIKTYWTFHDCWSFTGYCVYFDIVSCEKWKKGCLGCPQKKQYSWFFDKSKKLYQRKKELIKDIDLTIVTPSCWLADLVKKSFFKDCDIKVINNGIDLETFKPRESDFRKQYSLEDKYILLGVAFGWGNKKGLDVFLELSRRLPDKYQIVLVGTNDETDKCLPDNIISIHKTNNQTELAEIYSSADLFVNPTREENYPTVNMESLACGTPVLTFKTGGSPEIIDEKTGYVVEKNDVDEMEKQIIRICENGVFSRQDCIEKAKEFNQEDRFKEYINLYE